MKSKALAADTYPAECCRAKGVTSIQQLTGLSFIQTQTVIDLLLCRPETVFLKDGSYSLAAQQFAVFIGLPEDMLFGEHPDSEQRRHEAETGFVELHTAEPIDPEAEAIQESLKSDTTRVLASLTPRAERVLRMRFGIGMNTDHTLEEVGQPFSVTRERIREIEAKAIKRLKHPSKSRILREFINASERMSDSEFYSRYPDAEYSGKQKLLDLFDSDPTACFDPNVELRAELHAWGVDRLED